MLRFRVSSVQLDAEESIFFARALEAVEERMVEKDYPALKCRSLIPVDFNYDPADTTIVWFEIDKVGAAKIVADYSEDFPRVDVFGKENRSPVKSLGDSYGMSVQEVRAARKSGRPLDAMRAQVAREAILKKEDDIAWEGDTTHNLAGFLNNASVPTVSVPADGTGASKLWSTKDADKILRDLQLIDSAVFENTNGIEMPDTLILPLAQYRMVTSMRIPDTSISIAEYFLKSSFIKSIDFLHKLSGAGETDTDRAVVYKRDATKVKMAVVMDVEQGNPIEKKRSFEVCLESRTGGIIWYKPFSAAYCDGI